jgi:hypothetical protein
VRRCRQNLLSGNLLFYPFDVEVPLIVYLQDEAPLRLSCKEIVADTDLLSWRRDDEDVVGFFL